MDTQAMNQTGVWYSYGLVLFVMLIAVAGAALKDSRLANAAAKSKSR